MELFFVRNVLEPKILAAVEFKRN